MTDQPDTPEIAPEPDAPEPEPAAHIDAIGPSLEQLREWGYRVEVSQAFSEDQVGERVDVYYVEGCGLAIYARSDDTDYWTALADPAAHAERVAQQDETHDETTLRWHDDPDHPYEIPAEQIDELRERVAAQQAAESEVSADG